MGITLVVLAILQYRWIGEVGQAERVRLRSSLDNAVRQFRNEFNSELRRLCIAFELEPDALAAHDWDILIERYDDWRKEERHTKLVEDVFLLIGRPNGESESLWLDDQAGQWLPSELPERLAPIRRYLGRMPPGRPPASGVVAALPWRVLTKDLALVEVLPAPRQVEGTPAPPDFLMLSLDARYFKEVFLAEMIRRHFRDHPEMGFEAAVVSDSQHPEVVCASDPQQAAGLVETPDVRIRLLWDPEDLPPGGIDGRPLPAAPNRPTRRNRPAFVASAPDAGEWQVVARFRAGSLDQIVSRSRRRNLAVSFGVLVLLAAGMTLIFLGARRSHQLAELQMRFVAGVSHDLRTPLAVICSAAENLADGVFDSGSPRVREYGAAIRAEGRKLSAMVEQILQYASLKPGSRKQDLQPVDVSGLINAAIAEEQGLAASAGIALEAEIAGDLPPVLGHRAALQQALRNLVANSLKHAASGRWVRIRATRVPGSKDGEIAISVEDKGPGIPAEDLPHVFDPFYRGRNAVGSGVPGSGLGLSVVKQSVAEMGGRVSVRSAPGLGSTFTICLPSASPASASPETQLEVASNEPKDTSG